MIDIIEFFAGLKEAIEKHSSMLKQGDLFLPEYLPGRQLTKVVFPKVIETLASSLNLEIHFEYQNKMPPPDKFECGRYQLVDYCFHKKGIPIFFLELESLDRSQLSTFLEHDGVSESDIENKLWYYYGTLVNYYIRPESVPRYFVWLLILPNRQVEPYQIWDVMPEYNFFHKSLKRLIYQSPYRFYDNLIKNAARLFIAESYDFENPNTKKWESKRLIDLQDTSELIFITCTIDKLVLSRGRDAFSPDMEVSISLDLGEP